MHGLTGIFSRRRGEAQQVGKCANCFSGFTAPKGSLLWNFWENATVILVIGLIMALAEPAQLVKFSKCRPGLSHVATISVLLGDRGHNHWRARYQSI